MTIFLVFFNLGASVFLTYAYIWLDNQKIEEKRKISVQLKGTLEINIIIIEATSKITKTIRIITEPVRLFCIILM